MTIQLSPESGHELTARWHDQTLDLESLRIDQAIRECAFIVTEQKQDEPGNKIPLLQKRPLQRCRVTVKGVTRLQIVDAEGEVELYINEVEASPTNLRIKCVNGVLELSGEAMEVKIDIEASNITEINLATPLGDVSWRRKQRRPSR